MMARRGFNEWRNKVEIIRPPKNESWGGRTFDLIERPYRTPTTTCLPMVRNSPMFGTTQPAASSSFRNLPALVARLRGSSTQ